MADSKRLVTLKRLTNYLEDEVSLANGYKHDLADSVFRGRMFTTNDDPLPLVTILENIDPDRYPRFAADENNAGVAKTSWILLIQGWAVDDKLNPTDPAYELMADVRKALAKLVRRPSPVSGEEENPDFHLGGVIAGMTMEPGIARPPIEQVSAKAFFWMRVILKFVEDQNDPYELS